MSAAVRTVAGLTVLLALPAGAQAKGRAHAAEVKAPEPAPPEHLGPMHAALTIDGLYVRDRGFDLVSPDGTITRAGLSTGFDVVRSGRLVWEQGASLRGGTTQAPWAGNGQASLELMDLTAFAAARVRLFRYVEASSRLDLGATRAKLALVAGGTRRAEANWGGVGRILAGLTAHTEPGFLTTLPEAGFSLAVEGGYSRSTSLAFAPAAPNTAKDPIATRDQSLGDLTIDGYVVEVRFALHL